MNVGDITGNIFIYIGLAGLVFALLVKVLTKLHRQYIVHYEYMDGRLDYDVVKAFSKYGAAKKGLKSRPYSYGRIVTKVVRCREGR